MSRLTPSERPGHNPAAAVGGEVEQRQVPQTLLNLEAYADASDLDRLQRPLGSGCPCTRPAAVWQRKREFEHGGLQRLLGTYGSLIENVRNGWKADIAAGRLIG